MTARFIWTLTWGDDALGTACTDVSAGIVGGARVVLAKTREQRGFTRRAYASALLGSVAANSHVAELWVKDEPRNPDALLLCARAAVHRVLRMARRGGPYDARVLRMVGRAERACLASAEQWDEDPTPWVSLLGLGQLRLRRPVMPSDALGLGPLPGPWDLVEGEIWPRDRFNREAGHRLLTYFSPRGGGSNVELNEFATWAYRTSPIDSPLRLLPLAADLEHVGSVDADMQDEIARHRRLETLRRCIAEAEDGLELFRTDDYGDWCDRVIKCNYVCLTETGLTRIGSEDFWAAVEEYEEYNELSPQHESQSLTITAGDASVVQTGGSIGGSVHTSRDRSLGQIPIDALRSELAMLRTAMAESASDAADYVLIGAVAEAEDAAGHSDEQGVMRALARVGKSALQLARDIGAEVAAAAISRSLGM